MALELIPIGTILAVLTNQVIKTAQAAKDVLFEKDSFRVLSKHLFDIEPVLRELQLRELNDSQAVRLALESLEANVKKANTLVEKYRGRSRFYLLIKCRHIVKEVQQVTRDIGQSLAALSLTNAEVLTEISEQVDRLQNEMQRVELQTSRSQLQILDRLDQGIKDQKSDQAFANDILEEIAQVVGVPVEPSEISKELQSFRKEKEEAASRKERAEELFLGQVIELLSRADAARDYEEVKSRYLQRVQVIEKYGSQEYIPPLNAFTCPINGTVMVDPVSLPTGTTCEKAAIEGWLERGERTDPETGEFLHETSLRSNIRLRQSIEEWRELNYCLGIRSCRAKLLSGFDQLMDEALAQMRDLMREDSVNKDWVSIGGLIDTTIDILGSSHNKDVKKEVLVTLKDAVEGHARNKEQVIESKGWDLIVPCLGRDSSISKAGVTLLYELLQDRSGWNVPTCRKLSEQSSAILFLVTLLRGSARESAEYAKKILNKLIEMDKENISRAARSGWYKPLIDCIVQGPDSSRLSAAKSLIDMELVDSSLEVIGKEGIILPLLEMITGNLEAKELSLSALVKLLSCRANKELLATAGGVPRVIKVMVDPQERTFIITRCCEVLEKLTSEGDGIRFIVDGNGSPLELDPILAKLLEFQMARNTSQSVLKPTLHTILAICKPEPELVKKAVMTASGISAILPLLDESDSDIREVAVSLLFHFSQHEPEGVVEYLLRPRRLEALVGFLENENNGEVQMAAAGLLANLPKSEVGLTMKLIELDGLSVLIKLLRSGKMQAKENALSALFRFTDPANIESQHVAVGLGLYPLLVNLLRVGSVTAKARAAALIGNLSLNSTKLSISTKPSRLCFCFRPRVPLCPAHGGVCSVESTFCLLRANALSYLVELLGGEVQETAYEAIQALSTLVRDGPMNRGASVLHEAEAIKPALEILTWGTEPLKEEALKFLEKVFQSKEMVELYGSSAKLLLASITGRNIHVDGNLGRAATNVLALIERYSKSSTSIIPGLFA
ncbi:hypothetical protein CDL15_Pgr019414 [Punica granatum]|uniref:RING-type E3 ubiquitin transferase n=1 Tax=Punica granatum TaxID=22663 RepID=A0A218XSM7_PUNGR|nr:hypothetical protein CDL15_Pgr019414 [Punica granatum]